MSAALLAVLGEAVVDLVEQTGAPPGGPAPNGGAPGNGAGPAAGVAGGLYRAHPGGSPLNVAVGLGRLGHLVELHARISRDAFGRLFRAHLAASGVGTRGLVAAAEPSTLAVASVDAAGVASYDFWLERTADWQWTPAELAAALDPVPAVLHTGSMVLEVEPGASAILDLLRSARGTVTISYDPNVRLARRDPGGAGRARAEEVAGLADIVKASAEDLAWLRPGADPLEVAAGWAGAGAGGSGPALVLVTYGEGGSAAVTAGGVRLRRAARGVAVVDTVGAGDAFMAGTLDWLAGADLLGPDRRAALAGLDTAALAALLDHASLVAALTCARPGADPPTRAELGAYA